MDGAAANGYLAVVKWLHYHRKEGCTRAAADNAAGYGHLEVLKFLHKNRSNSLAGGVMLSAAANDHLNVVKWLRLTHCDEITVDMIEAARNVDALRCLQTYRGDIPDAEAIRDLYLYGTLNIVVELDSNGRFGWEEGTLQTEFRWTDPDVSCWMWSKRPQDMRRTLVSVRGIFPEKVEYFERVQDTIAPGWRERIAS